MRFIDYYTEAPLCMHLALQAGAPPLAVSLDDAARMLERYSAGDMHSSDARQVCAPGETAVPLSVISPARVEQYVSEQRAVIVPLDPLSKLLPVGGRVYPATYALKVFCFNLLPEALKSFRMSEGSFSASLRVAAKQAYRRYLEGLSRTAHKELPVVTGSIFVTDEGTISVNVYEIHDTNLNNK